MWPKRASHRTRHSVGGGASLREALRNRGGAAERPTAAQSEAEFEAVPAESEPEKSGLEWLNLNAFAPRAMQRVAERLLMGDPLAAAVQHGAGSDAEEAASRPFRLDGIRSGSGEGVDMSAIPSPCHPARAAPAASGQKHPKKATGIRAALQARGGMQRANTMQVTVDVPHALGAELAADPASDAASPVHSSPQASSPLPSVEEDPEAEAADHEARVARPADAEGGGTATAVAAAGVEAEGTPADAALAGAEVPGAAEEPTPAPGSHDEAAAVAREAIPATGAKEPELVASDLDTEAAPVVPEGDNREDPHDGAAPAADNAVQVAEATTPFVGGSSEAKAVEADAKAVSSSSVHGTAEAEGDAAKQHRAVTHKVVDTTLPVTRIDRSQTDSFHMQHFNRPLPKLDVDRPLPWKASLKAREEPKAGERRDDAADRTKEVPRKLTDLQQFWGKNSIGFAGPQLGTKSKLSKNEAQAALQRLIAAGNAVDFDEVRRLRKMTAEAND